MIKRLFLSFFFVVFSQSVFAADLYSINITSPGSTPHNDTFKDINDLIDASQQTSLDTNLENYDQNSAAVMDIKLGDKKASITYGANSTDLIFSMDSCKIGKTFTGGSRAINEEAFRKYINENRDNVLQCVNAPLIGGTIIGNTPFVGLGGFSKSQGVKPDRGIGFTAGYFSVGKQSHNVITLPLSYTHYFEDPKKILHITAPLSYMEINGSKVYKASLGAAYSRPINDKWSIIPAARIGVTASDDMGIGATVLLASLSNTYEFSYNDKHITLANMVGVLKSVDFKLGSFDSYYDVNNQVIKNGITVEYPMTYQFLGGKTSLQLSLANTQFFGDDMFVDNYTDIAFSMGTTPKLGNKDNTQDSMQLGLTYTVGNHGYKGGKLNFGYEF